MDDEIEDYNVGDRPSVIGTFTRTRGGDPERPSAVTVTVTNERTGVTTTYTSPDATLTDSADDLDEGQWRFTFPEPFQPADVATWTIHMEGTAGLQAGGTRRIRVNP